jgi:transposase
MPSGKRTNVRIVDRQWLEERLAAGRSYEEIGREVGRHPSTVSYWARRHGLASVHVSRHVARGGIDRDVLSDLVNQGLSVRQMAAVLHRSYTTVRHWLRVYGFETRRTLMSKSRETNGGGVAVWTCPRHGETSFIRRDGSGGWRCLRCRAEAVK